MTINLIIAGFIVLVVYFGFKIVNRYYDVKEAEETAAENSQKKASQFNQRLSKDRALLRAKAKQADIDLVKSGEMTTAQFLAKWKK